MDGVIQWLAPILSTIIVTAATASINAQVSRSQRVADARHAETEAKRATEAAWRDSIDRRLGDLEDNQKKSIEGQCSQIRSDIVHKCHRYLDDLGMASTEEKQSLDESYRDYQKLCKVLKIENHFIDQLVQRVMQLPEREV